MESPETDAEREEQSDQSVEEFVEEVENDPASNPQDPDEKRIQGG